MIIKSATGDVDLSRPENIRRGMLFRGNGRDFVAACDGQFSFDDGAPYTFLGCHPEIARREDCERFGIPLRCEQRGVPDAPIHAWEHGFARTREGFAVDLQRVVIPGVVIDERGSDGLYGTWVTDEEGRRLQDSDRFVGLHGDHASAEDVERLCCGEYGPDQIDGANRTTWAPRCSLAIGDHDEHRDIAAGVKWAASKALETALVYPPDPHKFGAGTRVLAFPINGKTRGPRLTVDDGRDE